MANCWNTPRCSAITTARRASRWRRRSRRAATCCSTSTGRARSNCARKRRSDLVSVFILPPSIGELERRLHTRAQDDEEMSSAPHGQSRRRDEPWAEYDYVVVNRDLDDAFADVRAILAAERLKRERQLGLSAFVRGLAGEALRPCNTAPRAHDLAGAQIIERCLSPGERPLGDRRRRNLSGSGEVHQFARFCQVPVSVPSIVMALSGNIATASDSCRRAGR